MPPKPISSIDLAQLIEEAEVARGRRRRPTPLKRERARSLDPMNTETAKSRGLVQDVDFDRLQAALPKLRERLQRAEAALQRRLFPLGECRFL